jgi:hypothetical protein
MTEVNIFKQFVSISLFFLMVFIAVLFTAGLIFEFIFGGLKCWHIALPLLFYLKSVLLLLIFVRTRSPIHSVNVLLPFDLKMLAVGWTITAILFIVSILIGEGIIGFFGAPIYLILGMIFWYKGMIEKKSMSVH